MATITDTSRTTHLLALMKKGDDAFNAQNVAAMNATIFVPAAPERVSTTIAANIATPTTLKMMPACRKEAGATGGLSRPEKYIGRSR